MPIPSLSSNDLTDIWKNVLMHPTVRAKNRHWMRLADIEVEVTAIRKGEIKDPITNVVNSLITASTEQGSNAKLASFARELVDLDEFQLKTPFLTRLALRKARDGLAGEKSGLLSNICNICTELKITFFHLLPKEISYMEILDKGVKALNNKTTLTNLEGATRKQAAEMLESLFPNPFPNLPDAPLNKQIQDFRTAVLSFLRVKTEETSEVAEGETKAQGSPLKNIWDD